MRLNVDYYRCVLTEKGIADSEVIKSTGLSKKTYEWILKNGFIECETLERIADAIGCNVGDILKEDPLPKDEKYTENVIEWVKDEERATLTLSQRRTITRIKELAESYPKECQVLAENKDGSVYAHIPVKWIRINPPMNLSEEQREKMAERMRRNCLNVE